MKTPEGPEGNDRREDRFVREIRSKASRQLRARREGDRSILKGLGLFGVVGWSISLPTLLGLAVGRWIDTRHPGSISWTLTFLLLGVLVGCWSAWNWIQQQQRDE